MSGFDVTFYVDATFDIKSCGDATFDIKVSLIILKQDVHSPEPLILSSYVLCAMK